MNKYQHIQDWQPYGITFRVGKSRKLNHWDRFAPNIHHAIESFMSAAQSEWPDKAINITQITAYTPDQWQAIAHPGTSAAPDMPWDDCKVAFGWESDFASASSILDDDLARRGLNFPDGWTPCEVDGGGARTVVVFRVQGLLMAKDAEKVRDMLARAERLA